MKNTSRTEAEIKRNLYIDFQTEVYEILPYGETSPEKFEEAISACKKYTKGNFPELWNLLWGDHKPLFIWNDCTKQPEFEEWEDGVFALVFDQDKITSQLLLVNELKKLVKGESLEKVIDEAPSYWIPGPRELYTTDAHALVEFVVEWAEYLLEGDLLHGDISDIAKSHV